MMIADEIRAGVRALEPWFHQIDLGHGIKTKSAPAATEPIDHPEATWRIIKRCLPEDLAGKSVLDVGCNAGFYAIEAKRRNAARVVGIDSQRLHIRQARFAARALGLDIAYERMSVYDLSRHRVGRFDVTLALGLIYHCKHVVLALERLFQVTGGLLILESAVLPSRRRFESFAQAGIGRRLHAMAYVENDPSAREAVYNWFVPSAECLCALLRDVGFIDSEIVPGEGGRAVIVCRRPRAEADSLTMPQLLAAELKLLEARRKCRPGAAVRFRVRAKNSGQSAWLARAGAPEGKGAVRLGVHLLDERGDDLVHDYSGFPLPKPVAPGAEVVFDFTLAAPPAGRYQLEFDMVSEHLTWFEDAGSTIPLVHALEVA
jgi:tRNA (mo5U34)-methyltransferase